MATYTTSQKTQPPQSTHTGIAAFNATIERRGEPGAAFPDAAASYGLGAWLAPMRPQHSGHSPSLDARGDWPFRITGFGAQMHRATIDRTTYMQLSRRRDVASAGTGWGTRLHQIVQRRYANVPIWAVLGPPGQLSRMTSKGNYPPFAKAQPNVRAKGLAAALNASAQAIQQARGG
jgi:hypothetical protein